MFCQKYGGDAFTAAEVEHQVSRTQTQGTQHFDGQIQASATEKIPIAFIV